MSGAAAITSFRDCFDRLWRICGQDPMTRASSLHLLISNVSGIPVAALGFAFYKSIRACFEQDPELLKLYFAQCAEFHRRKSEADDTREILQERERERQLWWYQDVEIIVEEPEEEPEQDLTDLATVIDYEGLESLEKVHSKRKNDKMRVKIRKQKSRNTVSESSSVVSSLSSSSSKSDSSELSSVTEPRKVQERSSLEEERKKKRVQQQKRSKARDAKYSVSIAAALDD